MENINYKISDSARAFLEENLPEALSAASSYEALKLLYELIDSKGFEPPRYEKLSDWGEKADEVYDEIYLLNCEG